MTRLRSLVLALMLTSIAVALGSAGAALGGPQTVGVQSGQCTITQNRSLEGKTRTTIRFVNQTKGRVRVDWLNYTGGKVFYKALAPGVAYTQATWLTHPWIVLNSAGHCIGYVIAGKPRVYIIR